MRSPGVLNDRGNVLGLMPHPEHHVESAIGPTDGRAACSPDLTPILRKWPETPILAGHEKI